jgi:hypothetical protein
MKNIKHLPLQRHIINTIVSSFSAETDVVAGVLVGSLAAGTGDKISDADVILFTKNAFHKKTHHCFKAFETGMAIFNLLEGQHNDNTHFRKYIFNDMTSAEIHCFDISEEFEICRPYQILFDKTDVISARLSPKAPPKHEDFPVYMQGDAGLIWELFDCIKWLSRGKTALAKGYLKRLAEKL